MTPADEAVAESAASGRTARRQRNSAFRREAVLEAAQSLFLEKGLEGTSLRAVAAASGYSPSALYRYFDGKEALYGALIADSLGRLQEAMSRAAATAEKSGRIDRLLLAFYQYYRGRQRELDLGLHLFGGTQRRGLGAARDRELNALLLRALRPLEQGLRDGLRMPAKLARARLLELTALSVGLLILENTGRLATLGGRARPLLLSRAREIIALESDVWR